MGITKPDGILRSRFSRALAIRDLAHKEAHRRLLYAAARRGLALVFALVCLLRHRRLLLLLGLVLGGLLLLLRRRRLCLPSSPAGLLATCK